MSSAANDFTTRTPFTFSSTMVATSARRAWISHEMGNIDFRICTPVRYTSGMVAMATKARATSIESM